MTTTSAETRVTAARTVTPATPGIPTTWTTTGRDPAQLAVQSRRGIVRRLRASEPAVVVEAPNPWAARLLDDRGGEGERNASDGAEWQHCEQAGEGDLPPVDSRSFKDRCVPPLARRGEGPDQVSELMGRVVLDDQGAPIRVA